jgi:hypothetical protein
MYNFKNACFILFQIKNKKDRGKITGGFLKSFSVRLSTEKGVIELKKSEKILTIP